MNKKILFPSIGILFFIILLIIVGRPLFSWSEPKNQDLSLTLNEFYKNIKDLSEKIELLNEEIKNINLRVDSLEKKSNLFSATSLLNRDDGSEKVVEGESTCRVNLNTASIEELQKLIGVGPSLAQKIIDARPFKSVLDLIKVNGIGEKNLQKIIEQGCAYVDEIEIEENNNKEKEKIIEESEELKEKSKKESFCPVNINTASKEELEAIIGIGPALAQRIIEARPFLSIYDLKRVSGIGETTLKKIIDQGCAYVENDRGLKKTSNSSSSSTNASNSHKTTLSTPSPNINLFYPRSIPADKEIKVTLSLSNFKKATYDVKISIEKDGKTLSDIYDEKNKNWQNSYNYLKEVFSGESLTKDFKLKIKEKEKNFQGEAEIIVRIRESGKSNYLEFRGKINIIQPEEKTPNNLEENDDEKESAKDEEIKENENNQNEEKENGEDQTERDITPPEIIFNLAPIQNSLTFLISFKIIDSFTNVSPSGIDGFYFRWKEEEGEWQEDEYQKIESEVNDFDGQIGFEGEDGKTYYFQIKAKDRAGNESDWVESFTKISLSKTILITEVQILPIEQRFIELYNPNNEIINLTGWYIQRRTATGTTWSSLVTKSNFENKIIQPNSYFLIARTSIFNPEILIENLTLTNDNLIVLKNPKGEIINLIGWGKPQDFEGFLPDNPGPNQSLARILDKETHEYKNTGDNAKDFQIQIPTPKTEN